MDQQVTADIARQREVVESNVVEERSGCIRAVHRSPQKVSVERLKELARG